MAEGSRYTCYFVPELVSGVTPAAPNFKVFRATKSGLDVKIGTLQSGEIRSDAEIADFRLGTRHVEGAVSGELSYGTFDDLIAAALRGQWASEAVKGGVGRQSFTFVDYNADVKDLPYTVYRGCEINSMTISASTSAMTTIEFNIVGRTMEQLADKPSDWVMGVPSATSPMDGFSGSLVVKGREVAVATEFTISIENGIEPRFVIGQKESIAPGAKRRNVKGSMTSYFDDNSLRLAYLNELEQSISISLSDGAAGNTYQIDMPRVKITESGRPIEGEGDVMQSLNYQSLLDSATSMSIKITRKRVVPPADAVVVTPAYTAAMQQGTTLQFSAVVAGTSNQAVTWTVEGTGNGTINSSGLYTAPSSAKSGPIKIKAVSTQTSAVMGYATIGAITA